MIRKFFTLISFILILAVAVSTTARAQDEHKWTINAGAGFGVPVASTSDFVNTGANVVAGGGYNFTRIIGVTGEFMWQGLPVKDSNIFQIGAIDAHSNLYSVTGNIKLSIPMESKVGAYAIGGAGWYRRSDSLTRAVVVPGTVCVPAWNFWVPVCVNGLVPVDQVIGSRSSDVLGANGGMGLTYKVMDNGLKVYAEARFHYAPTERVFTRVVTSTFGVRW
jgi:outer membrane protein with beta-barrel domain